MKLIIQIPAYNEETTIGQTLRGLPKRLDGFSTIETLVIDDGSTDRTIEAARDAGATHIVRLTAHRGLSAAFTAGLEASLNHGADVIVNTDADHQYRSDDIPSLVAPILSGDSDVVIGDRDLRNAPHMGPVKRLLQRLGSWAVSIASGLDVPDVTSGFRAFSRDAAFEINVFNPFTYTLETIIQAGNRNMRVSSVRIRTNPPTRPSRLYRGTLTYIRKSIVTIIRIYTLYRPLKTFFTPGIILFVAGVGIGARFLYYFLTNGSAGHIQSLILAAILLISGFQTILFGIVADLISVNRRLHEEALIRLRKLTIKPERKKPPRKQPAVETPAKEEADDIDTQWVWLGGEDDETPDESPATPRRRRRGGGSHRVTDPRDRKHHPRLKEIESKE